VNRYAQTTAIQTTAIQTAQTLGPGFTGFIDVVFGDFGLASADRPFSSALEREVTGGVDDTFGGRVDVSDDAIG
jgi:hypothetical protein